MALIDAVLLTLILVIGVLTFFFYHIRRKFSFWSERGVPYSKPHWLFGNLGDWMASKIHVSDFLVKNYKEFKNERFCGLWRPFSPILFIIDPVLVSHVLVKDFDTWSSHGLPFDPHGDPLSATLVNLEGEKWKSLRMKITKAFTPRRLKQMYELLLGYGTDFEKYLDATAANGGLIDVKDMSARFIVDVSGLCALGVKMNSFTDHNLTFEKFCKHMFEPGLEQRIGARMILIFPWLFKFLKLRSQGKEITDYFMELVKQTFDYREKNNVQRHDFADLLRDLKNTGVKDVLEYNDRLLTAQVYDFFLASFDSGSGTLSYCLHELAANEDIQDRLRKEIHSTKAAGNGEITIDSIKGMKYLDMVFLESLRKHPIITMVIRESVAPYRIPDTDVELPTGTMSIVPTYAIHHDPEYFPDPEKFDPERFTPETKSKQPGLTFLPFGAGPRSCVGVRLGEYMVKVALVKVIDNFKVSLCEKSKSNLEIDPQALFLISKDGIWLRISKISSN